MYNYAINHKTYELTENELTDRLTHLVGITKSSHWIGRDLKVCPSSVVGRFLWIIAKYFVCLRQIFYGVDLEESKSILQQLKPQLQQKNAQDLFNQAVSNFNTIAPRHQVEFLEEKQVDMQPEPEQVVAQPEPVKQEPIQPVKKLEAKIEISKNGYEVNAKIFDAISNREVGKIEGTLSQSTILGPCFHIISIGLKDPNDIGKGYGTSAFRQYLNHLQTSNDPQLKQVTHYQLVTHTLRPEPVACFKKLGFKIIEPKDHVLWENVTPMVADICVMMVKKRDADKASAGE